MGSARDWELRRGKVSFIEKAPCFEGASRIYLGVFNRLGAADLSADSVLEEMISDTFHDMEIDIAGPS